MTTSRFTLSLQRKLGRLAIYSGRLLAGEPAAREVVSTLLEDEEVVGWLKTLRKQDLVFEVDGGVV